MSEQPQRYHTLDGLRGVAAIAVLLYHADFVGQSLLPSGYLAVDLFFLLSGFVIDRTYRERLAQGLSAGSFLVRRIIRLYPSYIVGLALPSMTLTFALVYGGQSGLAADVLVSLPNWLMLPSLPWRHNANWPLFVYNGVYWSVFAELAVSAIYATLLVRLVRRELIVLAAVFAATLAVAAVSIGSANGGGQWGSASFGVVRALSSFLVGLLIARMPLQQRQSGAGDLLLLALPAFALAYAGETALGDLVAIFVVFPAVVFAGAQLQPRLPRLHDALGRISYPLYCLHMPVFKVLGAVIAIWRLDPQVVAGLAIPALIALAYAVDRWWDGPVRAAATRWLLQPRGAGARRPAAAEALG